MSIRNLIKKEVKKQFGQAPKMGDIHPTDQPDKERPAMENRPKNGMNIKQHKDMMWLNENADQAFMPAIKEFCKYAQKQLGFNQPVTIRLREDEENAKDLFGFTGHYNPNNNEIVVFTTGRFPKDIMRSVAHELVHHAQNCRGDFNHELNLEEGYAQTDPHMRKMEEEAFLRGNMIFRDWCDHIKEQKQTMLDEFNAVGGGAIAGFSAPLGMDMAPVHAAMWSGNTPQTKNKKKKK